MIDWIQQGGPVMYLLAGCSFIALAVIIERLIFWWRERRRMDRKEIDRFFNTIHEGKLEEARAMARETSHPVLTSMVRALGHRDDPRMHALHEALELEIDRAYERTRSYLSILETIVSLAPLLGIFGTVLGIIESFEVIGMSSAPDPQAVGAGLAEALITTATGLGIAMPSLIFHNFFLRLSNRHVGWLEKYHREFEIHSDELDVDPPEEKET
jgi:biopolymer transport protein ExbB